MKEKDAEIERLKAEWHGEIERSKLYAKGSDLIVEIRDAQIIVLKQLITELADALPKHAAHQTCTNPDCIICNLRQRAREVSKDERGY